MSDYEKQIKMYEDFIVLCDKEIESVKGFQKSMGDVFLWVIVGGVVLSLAGIAMALVPILILGKG